MRRWCRNPSRHTVAAPWSSHLGPCTHDQSRVDHSRRRRLGAIRPRRRARRRCLDSRRPGHRAAGVRPLDDDRRQGERVGRASRSRDRLPPMHRREAQSDAGAGEGPEQGHRRAAGHAVQAGLRAAARPGHAAAHQLRVDSGRGRRPERHRDRRRGHSGVRGSEAAELPQRGGLQEVPQAERPDGGRRTPARQGRPPVEQAPRQGRRGDGSGLRSVDRAVLHRLHITFRGAREAGAARRPHQAQGGRGAGSLCP